MNFWLQVDNQQFRREDLEALRMDQIERIKEADIVYIGDALWLLDKPVDALKPMYENAGPDTVFYLENYFIYDTCRNLLEQKINTVDFNKIVYGMGYKRIFDNVDTIRLLKQFGFIILHEDLDMGKMCISFKRGS